MFRRSTAAGALAAMALVSLSTAPSAAQERDIVETAVAAGSFNTLAAALEAADLVSTLKGEGPFTVFAPTDEAFAKLPEGTVESLLLPENRDQLVAILTYHVVAGQVTAAEVVELTEATTVNGAEVDIRAGSDGVRVNDSNVTATDVFATNGVIHVIDAVLLPPETGEERDARRMSARSSERSRAAAEILTLAIDRGVPLFNHGSPAATAAIYEVAARAVLAGEFDLPRRAKRALERGLRDGGRDHDMRDRAWTYREAMDRALTEIEGRMSMRDRH